VQSVMRQRLFRPLASVMSRFTMTSSQSGPLHLESQWRPTPECAMFHPYGACDIQADLPARESRFLRRFEYPTPVLRVDLLRW